jgi:hypothetical protein
VRPSHSKKAVWQIASQLPAPLIGKYASLAKAVNDNIMPLIALSGSFMKHEHPLKPNGYNSSALTQHTKFAQFIN